MTQIPNPLDNMAQALRLCEQGLTPTTQLLQIWREQAAQLPLPERYGEVLNSHLDRMESSALFTEESCSFSQKDQWDALKIWLEKASQQLQKQERERPATH